MHIEMKVSNKVIVKVEGEDARAAFVALAEAQDVFSHTKCGKCQSENVAFDVRTTDGNTYHSMRCKDCNAELSFGQRKIDGGLFVKRKDKAGNWIPDGGWYIFSKQSVNQDSDPFA